MTAVTGAVSPTFCPECGYPDEGHPPTHHVCTWPLCLEEARTVVTRGRSRLRMARCERHLRAELVTAERYGQALVVERLGPYAPSLLAPAPAQPTARPGG